MRKGQIISTDLLVSLILVAAALGLIVQSLEIHYQQAASTFESAKMHQIAIDAAAIKYYNEVDGISSGFEGLDQSAAILGYYLDELPPPQADACMVSSRGTEENPVNVYVCRGV